MTYSEASSDYNSIGGKMNLKSMNAFKHLMAWVMVIIGFLYLIHRSVRFLVIYDLSRLITGEEHMVDLIAYLLYLLFDVDVRTIDSLFNFFLR